MSHARHNDQSPRLAGRARRERLPCDSRPGDLDQSECDVAAFYAHVEQENTPVRWLPQIQPLHYAALRVDGAPDHRGTAANLARWLYVPVGPDYTFEEIKHLVLGIVKAAEYLGLRWRDNPANAAEYADLMDQTYGAGHDACRPLFALDGAFAAGD